MTLRDIQPDPHTFHRPIPKVSVIPPITMTPHEKWPQMSIHHKIAKSPQILLSREDSAGGSVAAEMDMPRR